MDITVVDGDVILMIDGDDDGTVKKRTIISYARTRNKKL